MRRFRVTHVSEGALGAPIVIDGAPAALATRAGVPLPQFMQAWAMNPRRRAGDQLEYSSTSGFTLTIEALAEPDDEPAKTQRDPAEEIDARDPDVLRFECLRCGREIRVPRGAQSVSRQLRALGWRRTMVGIHCPDCASPVAAEKGASWA